MIYILNVPIPNNHFAFPDGNSLHSGKLWKVKENLMFINFNNNNLIIAITIIIL